MGVNGGKAFSPLPVTSRRKADTGMPGYIQKITKEMANKMRKQKIRRKGILQG
jgi:hypothetical protein